jgi:ABC-type nitrate/sulfonate/bicarbonate transport system permease component
MKAARRAGLIAWQLIVPATLLAIWGLASSRSQSPFWPPLIEIFERFRQDWLFSSVPTHLLPTLQRLALGLAIAIGVGLSLGLVLGLSRLLRDMLQPLLDFMRSIPGAALIPSMVLLFGVGDSAKIAIVAFASVWPILLNTADGVRGVDQGLYDFAAVYRLRDRDRLFSVIVPSAAPQIFAGLRVALAIALLSVVVSEMFLASSGVGFVIQAAQTRLDIRGMWTGIFVLMILSYLINVLLVSFEDRMLAWHRGSRAGAFGEERRKPFS